MTTTSDGATSNYCCDINYFGFSCPDFFYARFGQNPSVKKEDSSVGQNRYIKSPAATPVIFVGTRVHVLGPGKKEFRKASPKPLQNHFFSRRLPATVHQRWASTWRHHSITTMMRFSQNSPINHPHSKHCTLYGAASGSS